MEDWFGFLATIAAIGAAIFLIGTVAQCQWHEDTLDHERDIKAIESGKAVIIN